MAETLVSLLGDSLEPVRTSAAECLGTLMKILGERAFNPYIEGVGELQMAKVRDAFEKAEIRYRAGGAAKGAAAGGPTSAGAVKKVCRVLSICACALMHRRHHNRKSLLPLHLRLSEQPLPHRRRFELRSPHRPQPDL